MTQVERDFPMQSLIEKQQLFSAFKSVRYAMDVTFQMLFRPSGNIQERQYYSGKRKLYGYQLEVSVFSKGFLVSFSNYYPSSISDLSIMQRMGRVHERCLRKSQGSEQIRVIGPFSAEYPRHCGMLANMGYPGAAAFLRVVHPIKKRPNRPLSTSEERYNR